MYKIGFIGTGNMGGAMLRGCLKKMEPGQIAFTDKDIDKSLDLKEETGTSYYNEAGEIAENSKIIVLSVKPQVYPAVIEDIKGHIPQGSIILSIAPSYSIASLKELLGSDCRIVRAMPNTPAMVSEGMTGVSFSDDDYSEEERELLDTFFSSFGQYEEIPEGLMDAVTAASGSSPAYVYMMIEALADGVVAYGMPRDKAYKFVAQSVKGAAQMVLESGKHPGELKDAVCSPGGTTIEAVASLEKNGFRNCLVEAADAVVKRCRSI